jgi:hypothetical protein
LFAPGPNRTGSITFEPHRARRAPSLASQRLAGDRDARRLRAATAIGGALVEHAGWEWCFVAAALTALMGFAVVLRYRPHRDTD